MVALDLGKSAPTILNGRTMAVGGLEEVDSSMRPDEDAGLRVKEMEEKAAQLTRVCADPVRGRGMFWELRGLGRATSATTPRYRSGKKGISLLFTISRWM